MGEALGTVVARTCPNADEKESFFLFFFFFFDTEMRSKVCCRRGIRRGKIFMNGG